MFVKVSLQNLTSAQTLYPQGGFIFGPNWVSLLVSGNINLSVYLLMYKIHPCYTKKSSKYRLR